MDVLSIPFAPRKPLDSAEHSLQAPGSLAGLAINEPPTLGNSQAVKLISPLIENYNLFSINNTE